ncbi:hypothetical protein DUNSADRAFT_7130 [Dunaliella salina]|uniref:Encoded protein n=1 Tax=Dunaliella salina TaxID=3046 RepID=A0ABQ7GLY8_DUNSA|nr:hypothetical protein DUNSADRAFT_7130 [Dunaliella salina]|eukprot:KAF5835628.1 hypothetical protein DUNSADRAFT_7130 [Dunaliella salina]
MAESVHRPAHPAQSDHNVDQCLLRRKSREAGGRSEGQDGGLAGHLERLSKQLDNIQAEHSQLFHNRYPDRENLAKSTARFLCHNGRHGPSSRPGAFDQADISLQAGSFVQASWVIHLISLHA